MKKRSHCMKGHPLSGDNLILHADGRRRCKICRDAQTQKRLVKCECGGEKRPESRTCHRCFVAQQQTLNAENKIEAHRLRRLGLTEQTIAEELGVPKGTVHGWLWSATMPPTSTTCACGEEMVEPAEKCGWCKELEYGGEPMPDLVGDLEMAA